MCVVPATQVRWPARSNPRPGGHLTGGGFAGSVNGSLVPPRSEEGAADCLRITRRAAPVPPDRTSPVTFGEKPVCKRWMRLLFLNPKFAADRLALGHRQRDHEEVGLARIFHTLHEAATGCRCRRKEAKRCAPWPATPPYVGAYSGYEISGLKAPAPSRASRVPTNAATFEWTRPDGRVTLGPQPR